MSLFFDNAFTWKVMSERARLFFFFFLPLKKRLYHPTGQNDDVAGLLPRRH